MRGWLVRGTTMAVLHAVVQVGVAAARIHTPGAIAVVEPAALGVLAGAAVLWGGLDGWLRRSRRGRGVAWFVAGLLAGPLAGVLGLVGQSALLDQAGVEVLGSVLTSGAAFTALLVMVPAELGLVLGGLVQPRRRRPVIGGQGQA
ncbi:B-4DMT family transporter [Gandjariella thermophila]|uniref:B-4DMT family transporter n=1 Tax=Gandjariella thermophila TaxID=1931992 RepID=UPI0010F51583|nr:B-4DMT family transporter [Gandjariella thermophila]